MSAYRTFTPNELANRDAWVVSRIENDCEGCETIYERDGEDTWRPAQDCPVHGEFAEKWWAELNAELDARWPGTWHKDSPDVRSTGRSS